MDRDIPRYTPEKQEGFSPNFPLRPNSLSVPVNGRNYARFMPSQNQTFENNPLRTNSTANCLGKYILGDPMLVNPNSPERIHQHGRPSFLSPRFEGQSHKDQHKTFAAQHYNYASERLQKTPKDAAEISPPSYLSMSPLFPHLQHLHDSQDSLSPFKMDVPRDTNFGLPFDSNAFFQRMNPSPLFHPSKHFAVKEHPILPPTDQQSAFPNLKCLDSFPQSRESVIHLRTPNGRISENTKVNPISNHHNSTQRRSTPQNCKNIITNIGASRDPDPSRKYGLEPLRKESLSNSLPNKNSDLFNKHLTPASKSVIHPAKTAHENNSIANPAIKPSEDASPCKSNKKVDKDDKELDVVGTNSTKKTIVDQQEPMKSPPNIFESVFNLKSNSAKKWLIKCSVQALDDLKARAKNQISKVDPIKDVGKPENDTDSDLTFTRPSDDKSSKMLEKSFGCESSPNKCKENLREDQDCLDKKRENKHQDHSLRPVHTKKIEHKQKCKCANLTDSRRNGNLDKQSARVITDNQTIYNSVNDNSSKHEGVSNSQLEDLSSSRLKSNIDCNNAVHISGEAGSSEAENVDVSDESKNELPEKEIRKFSELSREERAIQYALQKFQEMEQKQNSQRRKRGPRGKMTKDIVGSMSEKSDEDQDMVTERRKKRTNEQISDCEGKLNCKSMETNIYSNEIKIVKKKNITHTGPKQKRVVKESDFTSRVPKKIEETKPRDEPQMKVPRKIPSDEKDLKMLAKTDLQQKSYLLVPSYKGFKDFSPILLEGRTRGKSTQADTKKVGKQKFPILVVESIGEQTNEILVRENEDLDAKIAKESLLAENVFDETDIKAKSHVKQLSYNRMTGETVLHKAARLGYDDVIIIKIREGADVNARDHAGWTPLHEACSRGMTHVVKALLKYGADPNCCSENGIRPIHDAVDSNNIAVIRLLLRYGADASTETYSGFKILQLARTATTREFLKGYIGDIQDKPVVEVEDDFSKNLWEFRGSSRILDSATDDADEVFSTFPGNSERLVEFEASNEPHLPSYNLPVYGEDHCITGYKNYHKLQDVLDTTNLSRHAFLRKFKVELRSMTTQEFSQLVAESQLHPPSECAPDNDEAELVDLVHMGPYTSKKVFDLKTYSV